MAGGTQRNTGYFRNLVGLGFEHTRHSLPTLPAPPSSKKAVDTLLGSIANLAQGVVRRSASKGHGSHADNTGQSVDSASISASIIAGSVSDSENETELLAADSPAFDVDKVAAALQARLSGLELNLCNLQPEEEACVRAFSLQDWAELQAAAAAQGGAGISYVELSAELLAEIKDGLQLLPNLDCLSVWAPDSGGAIDFGNIKGTYEPLRINILGTPKAPLQITVLEGARVESRTLPNDVMDASVVRTRNEAGEVSAEAKPLGQVQTSLPATPPAQEDGLSIGVKALMHCASFDASGKFGIDLRKLTADQIRCVQASGADVWTALQADAKTAGLKIRWLYLHKDFTVDGALGLALKQLPSLVSISVSPPPGESVAATDMDDRQSKRPAVTGPSLPQTLDPIEAGMEMLLGCANFDASGRFGLDLKKLSPEQVSCIQKLGTPIWDALAADANVRWLHLHDDFKLTAALVLGLKQLRSLDTLSVATPARGMLVSLAGLQGSLVREVEIRCGRNSKWRVAVPDGVAVRPSIAFEDADAILRQSKVVYELNGKTVREVPLFSPPTEV